MWNYRERRHVFNIHPACSYSGVLHFRFKKDGNDVFDVKFEKFELVKEGL